MSVRQRRFKSNFFIMTSDFYMTMMLIVMCMVIEQRQVNKPIALMLDINGALYKELNKAPLSPDELNRFLQDANTANLVIKIPRTITLQQYTAVVSMLSQRKANGEIRYQYRD